MLKKLVTIFALSINVLGCASQDDGYDDEAEETGEVAQALEAKVSGTTGTNIVGAVIASSGNKGAYCLTNGNPSTNCMLPRIDHSLKVRSDDSATRNTVVSEINQAGNLGGSGWTIVSNDTASNNVYLATSTTSGSTSFGAFNTNRYLSYSYAKNNAVALEKNPTTIPGTYDVMNTALITMNYNRLTADCNAAFSSSDAITCAAVGRKHLVSHGLLHAVGVGRDIAGSPSGVTSTRDFYSSADMTPIVPSQGITTKTMLSPGQKCRARAWGTTVIPTNAVTFTTSGGCANN